MKFLQIIGTLDPAYGGPVEALHQLTNALNKLGHQSEVVTLDANNDLGIDNFPATVHALGPSLGKYRYNTRLVPWLCTNANRFDVVIVRGIWQYHSIATWIASQKKAFPYFVFAHGALDPWFRYSFPLKHLKKWLYWHFAEYRGLRDATAVLFTSEDERTLSSKSFQMNKVNQVVVNYGIGNPEGNSDHQVQLFLQTFPHLEGKRIILFLSRIHPKKGCDLLINAFSKIAKQDLDLHLVIAGPDQDGWSSILMKLTSRLGLDERITWTGMLHGDIKWGAYYAADVFILPSHSENFGVVVAEALACNLPVLITNKVNIWREIKDDNAGIVETDTLEGTVRLLQRWLLLSQDERQTMQMNAKNCFLQRFEINMAAKNLVDTVSPISSNTLLT